MTNNGSSRIFECALLDLPDFGDFKGHRALALEELPLAERFMMMAVKDGAGHEAGDGGIRCDRLVGSVKQVSCSKLKMENYCPGGRTP